tara:strand:+ start:1592 stop:2314 length:723 start_codon:yes stop_codon:yes gene_type:complete
VFSSLEDKIEEYFHKSPTLTKEMLVNYIASDFSELKLSTIDVYLSRLKRKGVITNPSRGLYSLSDKKEFSPEVGVKLTRLYNSIKKEYPFIEVCIWNTKWLNEFMRHQIFRSYVVIEVDKEASESVFYTLKDKGKQVFLEPDAETYNLYVNNSEDVIILRPLISEAPLSYSDTITVPTLEKLLVDMTIDTELYGPQRAELESIYENAFQKYQVNKNKMNRYALRRNREQEVKRLVNLTLA